MLLLCLFYWLIEVPGYRRDPALREPKWAFFFIVVGMNSITIYLGSRLIDFGRIASIFVGGFSDSLGSAEAPVQAVAAATLKWLFLYYLYRQKIFLKI